MSERVKVPVRARLAAWAVNVLGTWMGTLASYAQPAWDAEFDADVEEWEREERMVDRAYDSALERAYNEGYDDARNADLNRSQWDEPGAW